MQDCFQYWKNNRCIEICQNTLLEYKDSVPYYLIFILILSGAVDLLFFSFFPLEKNHFFKRVVLASDFEKGPFEVRSREPIRPQKGATASLMVAATSDMHGSLGILCVINCNEVKGLLHLAPLIQKLREENPQMLLLDGGDIFQGGVLWKIRDKQKP